MLIATLNKVLKNRQLTTLYQPIICMDSGTILGYEGLIRGPSDTLLHSPFALFKAARDAHQTFELERLCCTILIKQFIQQGLAGKLFLNLSPESLLKYDARGDYALRYMTDVDMTPERVVIELTESHPTYDYEQLKEAVTRCQRMGFQIAIDDLGEGFSSLRLWSELRPDFVKIDMHFIQGIDVDPVKRQFVRSIQEIAKNSGSKVIAEGIETDPELAVISALGISYGQGYHIARPLAQPPRVIRSEVMKRLSNGQRSSSQQSNRDLYPTVTAETLVITVPSVEPHTTNNEICEFFVKNPSLQVVPVVINEQPIGLISRTRLHDHFARPFLRELYGKRECTTLMDSNPLIVEKSTTLQELGKTVVEADLHHLSNGFVITHQGQYLGIGSVQDLMRELAQIQIKSAKYANPLTLLPGNVPINEHIEMLLAKNISFAACYADLDYFKPYNDAYGYRSGDDVIQMTAEILSSFCNSQIDFLGHIGGDDFMIVFQSPDWEARCNNMLEAFSKVAPLHHNVTDRKRGGYLSEDRTGNPVFHPIVSLSIGALLVNPNCYSSHYQVAAATADAKKEAKKLAGNSLFIERRNAVQIASVHVATRAN